MKKYSILFIVAFSFLTITGAVAQEFNLGADLMSRYNWRGRDFGNSPSIQPTLEFSYGNFTIGTWAAFSIDTDVYQEHDIYLSYEFCDYFSLGVTDYFFPVFHSDAWYFSNKYFDFDNETTGHITEINLNFSGPESFPMTLSVNTFFYGADKEITEVIPDPDYAGEEGDYHKEFVLGEDNNFSTYIEAGYPFKVKDYEMNVFLGLTTGEGFYGNTMGVVNFGLTGVKNVKITESFTLPVTASFITNPQEENIFFVFGISL